jgi:hypothetical protein
MFQEAAGCIIGKDYPHPMIDHDRAVVKNNKVPLIQWSLQALIA